LYSVLVAIIYLAIKVKLLNTLNKKNGADWGFDGMDSALLEKNKRKPPSLLQK